MSQERVNQLKIHVIVLALVIVAELIGTHKINLGFGVLALFPMLYALIMGGVISWPSFKWLKEKDMKIAANILGISFILLVAKLGTTLGPSVSKIFDAGFALSLQEVGHFIGTIILGLPVALLLGMKREAIGATFSIDREANLAIISEKYGVDSSENRGAIGVYICGTLFGAIYLGLLAGLLGSTGIFHPISLAMGAGIGSGSMMAAASGALIAVFPQSEQDIIVFAGSANLLTSILGTFVCVFFSLPVTERLYRWLEPKLGKKATNPDSREEHSA
ncbi:DUF3100 domain-containing protein [Brevibacillus sp. B_LB10_24]|uniref:DUF3100 domain-containing protein n=1 Tax=Brevibacillus sp. B_LB10_24 TaxID=3380645 RepID=UPI0038B83C00